MSGQDTRPRVPLRTVAREWTRIGLTGFGGPPAHIALLRELMVDRQGWMDAQTFQDANAACGLLPGPASTQMAMLCAYRVAGPAGVIVGGLGFVVPAVLLVLALSLLFLSHHPPAWVRGAGAGAGACIAAVAAQAALNLAAPAWQKVRARRGDVVRWLLYLLVGAASAVTLGPYLVVALLACGVLELGWVRGTAALRPLVLAVPGAVPVGGLAALCWTAFKVGALAFGGGFVIIPLMEGDAVHVHHWMTHAQFLNAVALGQVTPGPVVATVAAVGYAAKGVAGGLLAAVIAFAPSFSFILLGGSRFERIRANRSARAFLDGAGPAAIGAIAGSSVLLAGALSESWQVIVLAAAAVVLLVLRRGVVETILAGALIGTVIALAGGPLPH